MKISIIKSCIDHIHYIYFTVIKDSEVIGIASIVHPYTNTPVIQGAFVVRKYRKKGVWTMLYDARIDWIKEHNKYKYVYLFVHDKNPMIDTYKRLGFKYTGETYEKDSNKKWMKRVTPK